MWSVVVAGDFGCQSAQSEYAPPDINGSDCQIAATSTQFLLVHRLPPPFSSARFLCQRNNMGANHYYTQTIGVAIGRVRSIQPPDESHHRNVCHCVTPPSGSHSLGLTILNKLPGVKFNSLQISHIESNCVDSVPHWCYYVMQI